MQRHGYEVEMDCGRPGSRCYVSYFPHPVDSEEDRRRQLILSALDAVELADLRGFQLDGGFPCELGCGPRRAMLIARWDYDNSQLPPANQIRM